MERSERAYTHLPWLIAAMTGVAACVGALALRSIEERLVATTGEHLALVAAGIADKLNLFVSALRRDVEVLAKTPVFQGQDRAAMSAHLQVFQRTNPAYVWLAATDATGRIVAATDPATVGRDRSTARWFQAARAANTVVGGDVEPLEETVDGREVIAFTAPILAPTGEFLGAITTRATLTTMEDAATLDLRVFQEQRGLTTALEYQFLRADGTAFVDSDLLHKGRVNLLALGLPSARLSDSPKPGYVEEQHLRRHVSVITGYAGSQGYGDEAGLAWRVLVRVDRAHILTPIRTMLLRLGILGALLFVPMLVALLWATRRLRTEWEQASRQVERLKGLKRVSQALQSADGLQESGASLEKFLGLVIETAADLTGARYAALAQFDETGTRVVRFVTHGLSHEAAVRIGEQPTGRGLLGFLVQEPSVLRLKDLTAHPQFSGFPPGHPPMHSFLGVSIQAHGRVFGRLYLTEKRGADEFSLLDEEVIAALAADTGVAIENAHYFDQMQSSERLYRTTMASLPVSVARLDMQDRLLVANGTFHRLIALPEQQAAGRPIGTLLQTEALDAWLTTLRESGREGPHEVDCSIRGKSCLVSAGLISRTREIVLVIEDHSALKEAEHAIRRSRDFYLKLFDEFPALIWRAGLDAKCDYFNRAWLEFTGRPLAQELGDGWAEGVHPQDLPRCLKTYLDAFRNRRPFQMEYRLRRHDGAYRWITDMGRPFFDLDGAFAGYIGSCYDVTDHRTVEEQLRQSQKMEAVGQLAGGIAHDFNNLLTIINGHSEMLLLDLPPDSPTALSIHEIQRAGERAASLTSQLLAFSRKQMVQPRILNLNEVLQGLHSMLHRLIGEPIELVFTLSNDLWDVKADVGQIEQIVLNLAVNARDAMPTGGRLVIETVNTGVADARRLEGEDLGPGEYVCLRVTDNGVGMDAATRSRIFEPFFTTKPQGRGTGLGLSTVYGIVKQSGGAIAVESAPGRGTMFTIYLPRVEAARGPQPEAVRAPSVQGGSETILLVEDEDAVRSLVNTILLARGYTVLSAARGEDALRVSRDHAGPIHLLLTDVVMPGMSGRELREALAQARPGIRTLYMSGYTDDAIISHGVQSEDSVFLHKPFSPQALITKLREVLDA